MAMILPLADHFLIMMDSHSKIELHIYMQVKFAAENVRVSIFSPDTWEVRKFYFYDFVALIVEPLKKKWPVYAIPPLLPMYAKPPDSFFET